MSGRVLHKQPTTAVVGLGISGMSCLRHLSETDSLVVIDDRQAPANLAEARQAFPGARFYVGEESAEPDRWAGVQRVVLSPGVAANDPVLQGSESLPRCSDIDLFLAQANAPVVGITGTNGKSTVTALLGHVLSELGARVRIGGNLGEPALDLLDETAEVYVLELSSFQIEHSAELPLRAAVVLNVTADHLDRHGSLENYAAIKRRVYDAAQTCIANADDSLTQLSGRAAGTADESTAVTTFGCSAQADWRLDDRHGVLSLLHDGEIFATDKDFCLTGRHNMLNILAALALAAEAQLVGALPFADNAARYVAAAASFSGLDHRAALVRTLHGVRYVNDSKATNVGACIAALEGYANASGQPSVVLLAGGQAKGAEFGALAQAARCTVKSAILFGEDAALLASALDGVAPVQRAGDFAGAVRAAQQAATEGDTVLLAPACASFDMFTSFTDRGQQFCELVEALV